MSLGLAPGVLALVDFLAAANPQHQDGCRLLLNTANHSIVAHAIPSQAYLVTS